MEINVKISFEERFLGALERLAWVSKCTPATSGLKSLDELKTVPMTAPAGTFPKGESAQASAQATVPTETPAYTFEQIQVACANLAREGKRTELGNLIKEFGLASLPDLKEDQYNAFALKLREIGGTI